MTVLVVDRARIEAAVDLPSMAIAIEEAYRAASAGEVELPPVGHITFPDVGGDCHIKFGHRRGDDVFVIKVATGFPAAADAPTGNGLSLVLSATTGEVRAILNDEMMLTDVRTGVGGAIATRLLARPDATRVLVVGTGVQARRQIESHVALLDRQLDVRVWGRSVDSAARVLDGLGPDVRSAAQLSVAPDLLDACRDADIVITATASTAPIIEASWIRPGTHITAVGADAPGKHELDPALLMRADVLAADSRAQCFDHGELSVLSAEREGQLSEVIEIGELVAGRPGRRDATDISIADLTGIAAQDIAAARCVLDALSDPT